MSVHEPSGLTSRLYRLVLVASVGLLVVQLGIRMRARSAPAATRPAMRELSTGETLANITLATMTSNPGQQPPGAVPLQSLTQDRCTLLIFFDSDCSICQDIASDWRGRRSLIVGQDTLPVRWIGTRTTDTGAVSFMREYDLGSPWHALQSVDDMSALAVFGTPYLYIVSDRRVFLARTNARPENIDEVPSACRSRTPGTTASARAGLESDA